jgi:flotillin
MLPQIAPAIADALSAAKLVTIAGGGEGGAPQAATANIASVIQTVLAAQLVTRGGVLDGANPPALTPPTPVAPPVTAPALPSPTGQPVRR